MARTVGIGIQNFEKITKNNYFYVDKTEFIREWWENGDDVTLIARPRRFGKTLNMSMLETFFSNKYENRGDIFEKLNIWKYENYRELQGTYPVISLSFANVKETDFEQARRKICRLITNLYSEHSYLTESGILNDKDMDFFNAVNADMEDSDATLAIYQLSDYLSRYYNKNVIILLDEYDTPMQEAYVNGYWDKFTSFIRSIFNSTFKTNPYLERAVMTGITKVSKESIFSDLNNLEVVTITSDKYADAFGFTEQEVFDAMEEQGITDKAGVKFWYDGFTFGSVTDIYNPWSIINYLDKKKLAAYWANTSSNSLVGRLIRRGSSAVKKEFERLLAGEAIDEQIVYNSLDKNEAAIWSLLLASGYLKVLEYQTAEQYTGGGYPFYKLALTNEEVKKMFYRMVSDWFGEVYSDYNEFMVALISGDVKAMNVYMNRVCQSVFSYFDTGRGQTGSEPERFYHGFVLGLIVDMSDNYIIKSNRESGFGRYDIMIYPKVIAKGGITNSAITNSAITKGAITKGDGIIIEFKSLDTEDEADIKETVQAALKQIEDKNYAAELRALGFKEENIRKYGFAFEGKRVLIGE